MSFVKGPTPSGSITALQVAGAEVTAVNPIPITGSVYVINQSTGGAASNVIATSGSITGLLVGGVPVSNANPVPISQPGTVTVTGSVGLTMAPNVVGLSGTVTGLLVGGVAVSNANAVPVSQQGAISANATLQSGSITGLLYGGVAASAGNPIWITGSVGTTNAPSFVTVISGSVSGLLVGGVVVSNANPVPITGTIHLADVSTITGSVTLAAAPVISSGSVTGLLVGGVSVSTANPVPVGSHSITSGSVTGLLVGGVALSNANPVPITGTVSLASVSTITGSITLASVGTITGSVTLAASPNVFAISGSVTGLLVGGVTVSNANPVPVTGTVHLADVSTITGSITLASVGTITGSVVLAAAPAISSGSVTGLLVGGVALSQANPLPVGSAWDQCGQVISGSTVRAVQYSFGDFGTSGSANQVVAPQGANTRVRVLSVHMMPAGPVNVRWQSTGSVGTVNNISGRFYLPASGGFVLPHNPHGWFQTNANEGLNVSIDSAISVGILITWMQAGA